MSISAGDQSLQNALDKLADRRDSTDLQAICKTLTNRRGSIDLLENMDLDLAFLGNEDKEDSDGFFGNHTDFNDEDGISMSMDAIRQLRKSSIDSNSGFRGFDDLLTGNNNTSKGHVSGVAGRSASISSSSSMFGNTHADSDDALLQSFHTNIFDLQGHVEMSAYENMAKSLSATKPSQPSRGSSAKKSHGLHYMQQSNVMKSDIARSGNSGGASSSSSGAGSRYIDSNMQLNQGTPSMIQSHISSNIGDSTLQYNEIDAAALPVVPFHPMVWVKRAETEDGKLYIGAYSPEQRKSRIERFIEKRSRRVWTKKVKYDVRKNFADSRLRVKGRFVKKEDEEIMRELMTI